MTDEAKDWLRLHLTPGLGRVGLLRLMEAFGPAAEILSATSQAWAERAGVRPTLAAALPAPDAPQLCRAWESLQASGARLIPYRDREHYPPLLRTIHDPPALLYLLGSLPAHPGLAVVGSRRASAAGRQLTEAICHDLASRGVPVVSGLARGIDAAAHGGALAGDGPTVGVLGCGIDRVYPHENDRLFHRLRESGAIISEYPPGTPPLARHFPGRNRIISGLCLGVLVVEATEGSGSLITAEFALEQGREVFAVPGAVGTAASQGVNQLLKDGAHLVTDASDILDVLWPGSSALRRGKGRLEEADPLEKQLGEEALDIYRELGESPLHIDFLVRKSGLTPMEVSAILLHLELEGGVQQLPGMQFVRRRCPAPCDHHLREDP